VTSYKTTITLEGDGATKLQLDGRLSGGQHGPPVRRALPPRQVDQRPFHRLAHGSLSGSA